jgi:predicted Na+-dependent transporter
MFQMPISLWMYVLIIVFWPVLVGVLVYRFIKRAFDKVRAWIRNR